MIRDSIQKLTGVGKTRAQLFERLKIYTVEDLLNHFPRAYEDRRTVCAIGDLVDGEPVCVEAMVASPINFQFSSKGTYMAKFTIADDTGVAHVTMFNARYLKLKQGETRRFYGKPEQFGRRFSFINPIVENPAEFLLTGRILPVYPLTEGVSNLMLLRMVQNALTKAGEIPETLPEALRERHGLMDIQAAYREIHQPESEESLAAARRRMAFEELFYLSLGLSLVRTQEKEAGEVILSPDMEEFYGALPFSLTEAQKRCIEEGLGDMARPGSAPMRRMVQGDVGSGKTMVAAALAFAAARAGAQSAMMVPTEILAGQHYKNLAPLLAPLGIRVGLLTAGLPQAVRQEVRAQLQEGELDFVVGTHALISESVTFGKLQLVITDEQHRFGVRQRTQLLEKAKQSSPHMLVMSATPIPRTLAMVLYGDMDISVIDMLPPGRIPVDTRAPAEDKREAVYGFMLRQLQKGRQAYVVCPLVDESDNEDLKAATAFIKELRETYLQGYRAELLHGKLSAKEKDRVMADFASGATQVLVATTVIEVGVDVPGANMIIIENAERFGLSQLHQLRGRVGRSDIQSYCVLLSKAQSEATRERLAVMCRTNDGFEIAREDLRLRGPGEFFGERQSGVPGLKIAELGADMALLSAAHQAAKDLLSEDPGLEVPAHSVIREKVQKLFETEKA